MEVGIGIPNSVPGTTGPQLLEWARRAEAADFSSLATIGGVEYPTYEELTVLAAAGVVTDRIRLLTNVMVAPARSATEIAKQATSVDQLTGGRLTLGLGVGWRATDYDLVDRDFSTRGRRFDEQLRELGTALRGEAPTDDLHPPVPQPARPDGVPILVGGTSDETPRRVVEFGAGWTSGGLPPDMAGDFADRVRAAWQESGRAGTPRFVALLYFGLGDVDERARSYLLDYYGRRGEETASMIAGSYLRDRQTITEAIDAFAGRGFDELILNPTVADVEQVELLADAIR